VISVHYFHGMLLSLAFGTILLGGLAVVYRGGGQSVADALVTLTAFNTTFTFALICISVPLGALWLYWVSHGLEAGCFFAGLGLSAVVCFLLHFKGTEKTGLVLCLASNLLFVLFSIFFMSAFYDSSFDGRTYHQTSVYYLKNGWLPHKEQLFIRWCNEYPKAPWIWEALVYRLGGSIEAGKSINCLAVYALFNLAFYFSLRLRCSIIISRMFASLAVLNPVVITQFFSFYTDGLLYVFLACIVLLASLLLHESPKNKRFLIGMLLLIIPFAANIKFTGMIYAYLVLGLACVFAVAKRQKASLRAIVGIGILSLVLSIMVVGYNPYWTNVLQGKHLFHPLLGHRKIDIMTMNRPRYMNEHNPCYNFAASLLSRVSDNRDLREPEWRNPLQLSAFREIKGTSKNSFF